MIITLRDAAMKALEFYKQIDANVGEPQVEEVERDESTNNWIITLSFPSNESSGNLLLPNSASTGVMNGRKYKTFAVNPLSGEVVSMKIRVLQR